jgi:hypothetical protein
LADLSIALLLSALFEALIEAEHRRVAGVRRLP